MPYIHQKERDILDAFSDGATTPGELNYLLTMTCLSYLKGREGYRFYNDVIGALECCKLEMYRRAVAPYEDQKIKENGDVYV